MTRQEILEEAVKIITADRESQYGPPEDSFSTIAKFWQTYLDARPPGPLQPQDTAAMMTLLKIARIAVQPEKADSWIDAAGYSACGGAIATSKQPS